MDPKAPLDSATIQALLAECVAVPKTVTGRHLTDSEFVDFECGALTETDFERIEQHIASCSDCGTHLEQFCSAMASWRGTAGERARYELRRKIGTGGESKRTVSTLPAKRRRQPKVSWWAMAAGIAAMSIAVNAWLAVQVREKDRTFELARSQLQERESRITALENEVRRGVPLQKDPPAITGRVTYRLSTETTLARAPGQRSASNTVGITADTKSVELLLVLPRSAACDSCNVSVYDEDRDKQIMRIVGMSAETRGNERAIRLDIPASVLPAGRYTVQAEGLLLARERRSATWAFVVPRPRA
jgi:hypothetical protein